eukprot:COSAG04_NODE_2303_length_4361_cov_2.065228_5_plen_116_part_00
MEFNQLGDEGSETLVKGLVAAGAEISSLHLSENQITDRGIAALAPLLSRLEKLEVLFIGGNRYGDDGVASLTQMARDSSSLTGIRVSQCYGEDMFYIEHSAQALAALDQVVTVDK